jgi:hypothetical protein
MHKKLVMFMYQAEFRNHIYIYFLIIHAGANHPKVGLVLTCVARMYKLKAKSEGSSSIMVQEVSKSSFFKHLFLCTRNHELHPFLIIFAPMRARNLFDPLGLHMNFFELFPYLICCLIAGFVQESTRSIEGPCYQF